MKKVIIAACCVLAILVGIIIFDAVKTKRDDKAVGNATVGNVEQTAEQTESITETESTKPGEIVTKDRNAIINFTMPLYYLEDKYKNDLDLFCKENNYISCTVDEKAQTFTVTMNGMTHDFMLTSVGIQVIKNLVNVIESDKYPFFKKLSAYNDNFSEITVSVDKQAYSASTDKESFMAYIAGCGIYYQLYTVSNEYSCKVIVQDIADGSVLDAKLFKQNNSGVIS